MNPAFKASPAEFANRKCRFRRLRVLLFSSLFWLLCLAATGHAQCPNGKPQHPVYGCAERPSPSPTPATPRRQRETPTPAGRCVIQMRINAQEENQALSGITVYLNGSTNRLGKSGDQGELDFDNLPCNRIFRLIPSNGEFEFTPPYYDQLSSKKPQVLLFLASRRKVAALTPTPVEPPCVQPGGAPLEIKVGESRKDQLTSICVGPGKQRFYKDYALRETLGGDILHLAFGTTPSPDLTVEAFDRGGQPIKVEASSPSDAPPYFKIDLPVARDFLLRVASNANRPADYEFKLTRESLTNDGYIRQLQALYETVVETGALTLFDSLNANIERLRSADPVAEQKLTKALGILEQLQKLRPDKPQVHAMLAAIYLYQKKDLKAATQAAIESLKLGGEARFRVSFGKQIDKKERKIASGGRNGWLVLQKGEVYFEAFGDEVDRKIFTSPLQLLRKKDFDKSEIDYALSIYGRSLKEPKDSKKSRESDAKDYDFIPLSLRDGDPVFQRKEVAAIKGLLKEYILMEPPAEIRQ